MKNKKIIKSEEINIINELKLLKGRIELLEKEFNWADSKRYLPDHCEPMWQYHPAVTYPGGGFWFVTTKNNSK